MQKIKKYIPITLALTPLFAFAVEDIFELISLFMTILGFLIPLLIGLSVVIFLWGVVKYITAGGDAEKQKEGRNTMIFGIVGLFVMVSVWGLVKILIITFDIGIQREFAFPEL